MATAAEVPASEVNDAEMRETLTACADRAEWEAALRANPRALGFSSVTSQDIEVVHMMLCAERASAPACAA